MPLTGTTRSSRRRPDGVPLYRYRRLPGLPPVTVLRLRGEAADGPHAGRHWQRDRHAHDFLVLTYVESGSGSVRVDDREWPVAAGSVLVLAPGEVIAAGGLAHPGDADAWAVFFPLDVLDPPTAFLSWRAHPLLYPLLAGAAGARRLQVPPADRPAWSRRFAALERELAQRRDGYNEAVLAHLALLLVEVSRLAPDGADLAPDEPLLAAVFEQIEARYREPVSLQHIAAAVGLTPGHLTTVVGRRTGRTVQQWITERRMSEARRLLAGTELTVESVAGQVGYRDPSYFIRTFRRGHGVTPRSWREAGRC